MYGLNKLAVSQTMNIKLLGLHYVLRGSASRHGYYLLIALLLPTLSWADDFCKTLGSVNPPLMKSICDYYKNERDQNWSKAYQLRTEVFRETVEESKYVKQMASDNQNWKLIRIEILGSRYVGNKAFININYIEEKNGDSTSFVYRLFNLRQTMKFNGEAIWILKDDKWYCYDPVSRGHLSLNVPLVTE